MIYNYLDVWDIKLIKENMTDLEDLLSVIDDLLGVASDIAYDNGFEDGYSSKCLGDHNMEEDE